MSEKNMGWPFYAAVVRPQRLNTFRVVCPSDPPPPCQYCQQTLWHCLEHLGVRMFVSLWNFTGISAAPPQRLLSNFRANGKVQTRISRLRHFTRSCGKTVNSVNRGLGFWINCNGLWAYMAGGNCYRSHVASGIATVLWGTMTRKKLHDLRAVHGCEMVYSLAHERRGW